MNNNQRKYNEPDDFIGEAVEVYERFLLSMQGDDRFIKKMDEDKEGYEFIYTTLGTRLADRMHSRLVHLGEKLFPDYIDFAEEIETYLFKELD